ncbi:MAG: serine/threonine-protein kinase [Nannocystaceae bacterium]
MLPPAEDGSSLPYSIAQEAIRAKLFGEPARPHRVGRFHMLEKLGEGGMGVVYAAYDEQLDRKIALKFLSPQATLVDDNAQERMLREAQAMARLSHPNVVHVYDVGTHGEDVYLAMEFVHGTTLGSWLESGRRTPKEILEVFGQAGRGLAAAHAADLVHRDFKPSNVLLSLDGRALVTDFGSARGMGPADALDRAHLPTARLGTDATEDSSAALLAERLTRTGVILGTPVYMSPEQHEGRKADPRSDQFNFCVALHEALFGTRPFAGRTRRELHANIQRGRIKTIDARGTPGRAATVLKRGLAADPQKRFTDMDALLLALDRATGRKRRRFFASAGTSAVIAAGLAGWAVLASQQGSVCEAQGAAIDEVWNDARRAEIEKRFVGVDEDAAADARATLATLDAYADEWRETSAAACRDTLELERYSTTVLDRRASCLERRRLEFSSLGAIFLRSDPALVRRAAATAQRLIPASECNNVATIDSDLTPPQLQLAAQVDAVRGELSQANAFELAGLYEEGLSRAQQAYQNAEALQYEPLLAEALSSAGWLHYRVGDHSTAEAYLNAAVDLAESTRHDLASADAWDRLLLIARETTDPTDLAVAESTYRRTKAAIQRLRSNASERTARAHASMAFIYKASSHFDKASHLAETSLGLLQASDHAHSPGIVHSTALLGDIYAQQGRWSESLRLYDTALRQAETVLGPRHPRFATLLVNAGLARADAGQFDAAAHAYAQAQAIYEDAPGNHDDLLAWIYAANAELALKQHRPTAARRFATHSRDIYDRTRDQDDVYRADPIVLLARAEYALGNFQASLQYAEEALVIQGPTTDRPHITDHAANNLAWVGRSLAALGAHDQAVERYETAIAAFTEHFPRPDQHPRFLDVLMARGASYLALGKIEFARSDFDRAVAGSSAMGDTDRLARARQGRSRTLPEFSRHRARPHSDWSQITAEIVGKFPE